MTRLGKIIQSSGRNLVIQAEKAPEIGIKVKVGSEKNPPEGEVVDIFGPVERPYATIKLKREPENDPASLIDNEVFLEGYHGAE